MKAWSPGLLTQSPCTYRRGRRRRHRRGRCIPAARLHTSALLARALSSASRLPSALLPASATCSASSMSFWAASSASAAACASAASASARALQADQYAMRTCRGRESCVRCEDTSCIPYKPR